MVEFRIASGTCSGGAAFDGHFPGYALHCRRGAGILIGITYFSGCEFGMTPTLHPCERGFLFLYLLIQACGPRSLLWQLHIREDVDYRRPFTDPGDGSSLFGVCSSMRANKVLGCDSDHQSLLRFSILRAGPGSVTLGGICGG